MNRVNKLGVSWFMWLKMIWLTLSIQLYLCLYDVFYLNLTHSWILIVFTHAHEEWLQFRWVFFLDQQFRSCRGAVAQLSQWPLLSSLLEIMWCEYPVGHQVGFLINDPDTRKELKEGRNPENICCGVVGPWDFSDIQEAKFPFPFLVSCSSIWWVPCIVETPFDYGTCCLWLFPHPQTFFCLPSTTSSFVTIIYCWVSYQMEWYCQAQGQ